VRICDSNNSGDTKVSAEGGGGGTPDTGAETPLQSMEQTMVRQDVLLQPMEVHGGAGGCPEEALTLWRVRGGAGSWQDLWTHGEKIPCWIRFSGRTCDPTGDLRWGSLFLKDCTP